MGVGNIFLFEKVNVFYGLRNTILKRQNLAESKNAFQSFGQVLECIISEEINCFLEDFFLEKKMPLLQTFLMTFFPL